MVVAAIPAFGAAGFVLSTMAQAVKALYGMTQDVDVWLDKHIADMKGSENPTVSRSGRVLEMAKFGFGVGYITPVVIISVGQFLLGNTLSAIGTVASAAALSNPIAMTCAAIGAIYYGWGALSDVERQELLDKLSAGLAVGIELIKSMVQFVISTTKELLSSKNFDELKKYVGTATAMFGHTLADVTHKLADKVGDSIDVLKRKSSEALDKTIDLAADAYETVKESAGKAADGTREQIEKLTSKGSKDPGSTSESDE